MLTHSIKSSLFSALLLFQATSFGTPVLREASPSSVVQPRAAPPKPSKYPGTGTEHKNEWQYLNFDMENKDDKKNVEIIHNAFDGMRRLGLAALSSAVGLDVPYGRFFDKTDDDEHTTEVVPIYRQLIPEKDKDGNGNSDIGPLVAKVVIDNKDFNKGQKVDCTKDGVLAYTDVAEEKTHFCALGLNLRDTADLSCKIDLDSFVSEKMDSVGRVALHEMLHYKFITFPIKQLIVGDAQNKDEKGAFGPERAFALLHGTPLPDDKNPNPKKGEGENPGLVSINCDNYAWHSTNAFMAQKKCSQKDFEDPKDYTTDAALAAIGSKHIARK